VEFRRSLDAQGSTDLIPTAGPDAAADQGPAIKAVWEPQEPAARAAHSRRGAQDGRARSRRRPSGAGRRRSLIFGGAAAVVLVGAAVADLNSGSAGPQKGAATTVLPMVSDSPTPSQQVQIGDVSQTTQAPTPSGSRTPSHSPSPSHTASASARPSLSPSSPAAGGSSSASATASATPTATKSTPSCFLIFCG
jgi:hypothetical protein